MAFVQLLGDSLLFKDIDASLLKPVTAYCRLADTAGQVVVFREGSPAEELFLVVEGAVTLEIEVQPVEGRPSLTTAVEAVGRGECFGWSAVVSPYRYTASAVTLCDCSLMAIKGDQLRRLMKANPELGYLVMTRLTRLVAGRLRSTRQRLVSAMGDS
jgi:CRP-like cAMP-binding protein